jgi:gluconate 2-dehydrogenase gamma chain
MKHALSRREFFGRAAAAGALLWLAPRGLGAQPSLVEPAQPVARKTLNESEWRLAEAVGERILPGSAEAGGTGFLDQSLAGDDADAKPTILGGLTALDGAARLRHGLAFVELSGAEQDDLLAIVESGSIDAWPAEAPPPRAFFQAIRRQTIVGLLADPSYGGNRHHAGWKLAGYPGPLHHVGAKIAPPLAPGQLVGAHPIVPIWDDPRLRTRFL